MTAERSPTQSQTVGSHTGHPRRPVRRTACPTPQAVACTSLPAGRGVLGHYRDDRGRHREIVAVAGGAGGVLVVDREVHTLGDPRLVAHLAADEPPENAWIVCDHYLSDPRGRRCRRVTAEDLIAAGGPLARAAAGESRPDTPVDADLFGRHGRAHRLGLVTSRLSIPELRWLRLPSSGETGVARPLSLREVVADLESYEPMRTRTVAALARHDSAPGISVAVLRGELARLDSSRIVLNRGLREAVRSAVESGGLSMSEIALRCGRVKYDARGHASGETSWLARRVGILPEGGERAPTPWIHSDVLALIARCGLGISPREVEL